jgi:trans-aconitate 2-methyltransferase
MHANDDGTWDIGDGSWDVDDKPPATNGRTWDIGAGSWDVDDAEPASAGPVWNVGDDAPGDVPTWNDGGTAAIDDAPVWTVGGSSADADAASKDWDGATYDRIADPMARWGTDILGRLPLEGTETILDAGCGSGRVTELLLGRLPAGHVIALDSSRDMLAEAEQRLARFGDRVEFVEADLAFPPLPLTTLVDGVFSSATFHWVMDHDSLFQGLSATMKPGAYLVAQCGGQGNIESVQRVLDGMGEGWRGWRFESPEATAARLARAGFTDIETWLQDEPTDIPEDQFETYLETVILRANLARKPVSERDEFVRRVAHRLEHPHLDYVRLNIVARKA